MPANYVLLATQTVGNGGAASVTFENIPQSGYTDLKVVISTRSTTAGLYSGYQTPIFARFNGASTNYSMRWIQAEGGSTVNSGTEYFGMTTTYAFFGTSVPSDWTATTFGNSEVIIPNYAGSSTKSFSVDAVAENNAASGSLLMNAGLWNSTSAITTILIQLERGNFAEGSTFYLYATAAVGTTPAIAPYASGGDVIANDGTYWYHAFKTTGAFVPAKALTADILVVAGGGAGGGGGGGNGGGSGGGAGGLLAFTQSLTSLTSYTCSVGSGGSAVSGQNGTVGNDSQFGALTLVKGGGYGVLGVSGTGRTGGTGGSGGGGGFGTGTGGTAGSNTSGQGFNGGAGFNYELAGGGGGAGEAGNTDGNATGGDGVNTYSAWATATATGASGFYAGGGSGAGGTTRRAGGDGGGGQNGGSGNSTGDAGTVNSGGGGGGGGDSYYYGTTIGGNGGSGIVIIRYAMA